MNLKVRSEAVGYNNKILVCDRNLVWGKNDRVNAPPSIGAQGPPLVGSFRPAMKSHKYSKTNSLGLAHTPNISYNQEPSGPQTTTHIRHNEEKSLWYWLWQVVLQYRICFDESQWRRHFCMGHPLRYS